jgi:hypothetical protein
MTREVSRKRSTRAPRSAYERILFTARAQWTPTSEGARVLPGLAGRMGDSPHGVALDTGLSKGLPQQMPTQQEFAAHVGITRQAVGQMAQKGILPQGGTLDEWRLAYCANLREVAAGRQSETGGFDLTDERARLAKLQADKVEIELAELRGEVVRADDVSR